MTNFKRWIKSAERRLGLDDRRDIVIYPPKFTDETDEKYKARLAASDRLPRETVRSGNFTIVLPAGMQRP